MSDYALYVCNTYKYTRTQYDTCTVADEWLTLSLNYCDLSARQPQYQLTKRGDHEHHIGIAILLQYHNINTVLVVAKVLQYYIGS